MLNQLSRPDLDWAKLNPDKVGKRAEELFSTHWNCAEAVLQAICENLDMEPPTFLVTGLGGGVGNGRRMCGAITGGVVAMGLRFGRTEAVREERRNCYEKSTLLVEKFRTLFHSTNCWELSETLCHTSETKQRCNKFVETTARLAAEIMKNG